MQHRAYSVLRLKSTNDAAREFTGIASTPTPDRYQDIVEPKGAEYKLPLPLLWQHDSGQPIGNVVRARLTSGGIEVAMRLAQVDEPGRLKDRIDEAWQSIKSGLVRGLSIGFRALESARLPSAATHFLRWEWLELSVVTIPANAEATITAVKHYAQRSHREPVPLLTPAGRRADGAIELVRRAGR